MSKKSSLDERIDHEKRRWEQYLEDHSFPLKRKFPCDKRRRVIVRVDRWPGNPHHHVSIQEEPNPVWDDERGDWYETYYDSNGRGAEFSCKFFSSRNADAFIKLIWKDWFKPETHVLVCASSAFTETKTALQRKFDRWMKKVGD